MIEEAWNNDDAFARWSFRVACFACGGAWIGGIILAVAEIAA